MHLSRPSLRLLCPRLAWLLGFVLLAGLPGCGPAPSDQAANPEPRASVSRLSESPPVSPPLAPLASNPALPSAAQ
jgi:hypothetical protein